MSPAYLILSLSLAALAQNGDSWGEEAAPGSAVEAASASSGEDLASNRTAVPEQARNVIVLINTTKEQETTGKALIATIKTENPAIVRVNPSVSARSVQITGLFPRTTKVTITDKDGAVEALDVVVQSEVQYLRFILMQAVPSGSIQAIASADNKFILTGTVAKAEDVPIILATAQSVVGAGVVNALSVTGARQVQLDLCIAEVAGVTLPTLASSIKTKGPHATNEPFFGLVKDAKRLRGLLRKLGKEGLAEVLSEPSLVTASGKQAHVLPGVQFAVALPSPHAAKDVDLATRLTLFPIVLGNGKIYLEVAPVIDNVNSACGTSITGTLVPGFDKPMLHATVEMEPGQTFAAVFPAGKASGNAADSQAKKGLLILITSHVVDPAAAE